MRSISKMAARLLILILLVTVGDNCRAEHSPNELFVKLREPLLRSSLDGQYETGSAVLDNALRGNVAASAPYSRFANMDAGLDRLLKVEFGGSVDLTTLAAELAGDPSIEWVAFNNRYRTVQRLDDGYIPNDESFSEAYWLERISASQAWEITRGDSGIIIGIIDTGIDYSHRDLRDNLWHNANELPDNGVDDDHNGFVDDVMGWDFVDAPSLPAAGDYLDRDNDPMDDFGHGTYVAGCASATSDNAICYPGIGFHCKLMPLRAGNANGTLEEDDIVAALLYGADNGASIINMSFGDVVSSPLIREAVRIAHGAGVVLTASAGNAEDNGIHYPSGYPEVISVGATDSLDRKASFSNYGPGVEIFAPGDYIASTILGGECGLWRFQSGTSYAAPIVAGVAGLILSVDSTLSPSQVFDVLLSTTDDLGAPGWDSLTTNGRVNAFRAVEVAQYGATAIARIESPRNDSGVRGSFSINGVASGTAFDGYTLEYGLGENPEVWEFISSGSQRVYSGELGELVAPPEDTILVLRLTATATNGSQSVDIAHLYAQNAAPVIDSIQTRLILDADGYGKQILAWTNQFSRATLLMTNGADSVREDFGYVGETHVAVIAQDRYPGDWTAVLRVTNLLGESTWSDPFPYSSAQETISPFLYSRTPTSLPNGLPGPFVSDYDCDDNLEVWLLEVTAEDFVDTLEPYEWNGASFVETENTYGPHIPQDWGDADGDGLMEMAARRFSESRIWEQSEPCGIPNNIVLETFSADSQFLFGRFVTADSASGRRDILARVIRDEVQRIALFEVGPDYSLTQRAVLPNTTGGNNLYGQPRVAVGDFDHDERLDFFYGDYDGDLIWSELNGDQAEQVLAIEMRQNDATNWLTLADLDGDGQLELVAGCRSNAGFSSESQRLLQGWDYYIYECSADNALAVMDSVLILGNENVTVHPASLYAADLDANGAFEFVISAHPDLYVVTYDQPSGRYVPVWYDFPSESGNMVAADFNNNGVAELLSSDGAAFLKIESTTAQHISPLPPRIFGEPLGETTIRLDWTPVPGAQRYRLYRGPSGGALDPVLDTESTGLIVESVQDEPNDFAVATLDSTFPSPLSSLSNIVTLTSNAPPSVMPDVTWPAPQIIGVSFSEPMGPSMFVQGNWTLADGAMPAVVMEGRGARQAFLSFDDPFAPGAYQLTLRNLQDAQGTAFPANQATLEFELTADTTQYCYVLSHSLADAPIGNHVRISFSEAMSESVEQAQNYLVYDPRQGTDAAFAVGAVSLTADRSEIELELDPRYPVGAIGVPVRIELAGLSSASGRPLNETVLQIEQAAGSLDNVYVYPNPYRGRGAAGSDGVYFAGLPPRAMIRIFSVSGAFLRTIEHDSPTGHAAWDLRTDAGDEVASGIYIYKIDADGSEKVGKLAVAR